MSLCGEAQVRLDSDRMLSRVDLLDCHTLFESDDVQFGVNLGSSMTIPARLDMLRRALYLKCMRIIS